MWKSFGKAVTFGFIRRHFATMTSYTDLHLLLEPSNKERYEKLLVCKDVLRERFTHYFDHDNISFPQVDQWLSSDRSFGRSIQLSSEDCRKPGCWIWAMKKEYRFSMDVHEPYIRCVHGSDVLTIGYARKSHSNESQATRVHLQETARSVPGPKGVCAFTEIFDRATR